MNFSRRSFCALSALLVCLWACGDDSTSSATETSTDDTPSIENPAAPETPQLPSDTPTNPSDNPSSSVSQTQPSDAPGSSVAEPISPNQAPDTPDAPNAGSTENQTGNPVTEQSNGPSNTQQDNPPASSAVETPSPTDPPSPNSSTSNPVPQSSNTPSEPKSSTTSPEPKSSASEQPLNFDFYLGADISTVQEQEKQGTKFFDVDGSEGDIFTILKKHGFNAIRLRTFVSPLAQYGYAAKSSECKHSGDEAFGDKEHVIAYAKKVKAAGMAFLLDIHYSDNWADPGKQIIPERWRNVTSSDAMADSVYNYTYDLLTSLKAAGALPEMVQIGNETTPGILIHKPSGSTDCWGNNPEKASTAINGDMGTDAGKTNAAKYFNAGIKAVKAVSQNIKTVLHIERIRKPETVTWWMGVIFDQKKIPADVMGFSAYTAYGDGAPSNWLSLFNSLNSKYPKLEFIVAEYNGGDSDNHYNYDGSRKKTNEVIRGLDRWIGTFFWEPTLGGAWGPAMFDWSGNNLKANSKAFDEFK